MRQRPSGAGNPGLLMQLLFTLLLTIALLSAQVTAAVVESASQQVADALLEPEIRLERERGDPRAVARYVPQTITDVSDAQYNEPPAVQGHTPRSISQYNEDFVLLATVDGRLSARDRKSGKLKWELVTQDPAVRTTYHRANATRDAEMRPEDIDADDLIEWIVGPTEAGELYFFTPGKNGGRLEKLDVTVKDIIHNTPYKPANVNKVYNGGKTTVTYAINARTGVIERIFSADGFHEPLNDKKCKVELGNIDEEECEVQDKEEDDKIIMIGRTEYTITIQNWKTGEPLWTIKFNEWTPNNSDTDLRIQHQRPSDNRYIYSRHDGTIFGFSSPEDVAGEKKPLFTAQLDTPVVGVYDVLAPRDGTNELLVLPQPPYAAGDFNSDHLDHTYVGATEEGAWYALSERNLPYVTNQAKDATCYDYIDKWPLLPQSERQRRLVGKHKVHNRQVGDRTAYFNRKISGTLPGKVSNRKFISSGAASPTSERLLAIGLPEDSWGAKKLPVAFAAAVTVLLLGYFAINKPGVLLVPRLAAEVPQKALNAVPDLQKPIVDSQSIKSIPETVVIPPVTEDSALAAPPVLAEVVAAPTDQPILLEEKKIDAEVEINVSTEITEQHAVPTDPAKPAKNHVHFVEPEPSASPDGSETPKKKYARGRRGGKKKKRAQSDPETPSIPGDLHVSPPSVEEVVVDNNSVSTESVIFGAEAPKQSGSVTSDRENEHPTGEGRVLSTGQVEQKDGSTFILGRLEYDEKAIIGSGSQGTTVFKGKWEGRVVAIKRMLTTHAELAHKEVKLLQEADDHFNVVRYHCQQRWGEFLFIALELCRCSLYDLIAKPQEFEDLRKGFEPANCLFQIMDGLRHLHTLNIVHRDIKPQNILVGDPFNTDRVKTPRYLISDFGLCKKLQEDEYSFAATTAQHAGTFGWRAPELLNEYSVPWPSTGLSQNSEPSGGDGTTSSSTNPRRATSKIDIFSAGCLFYFVCSGGRHPFGDRYDREYNIIRNNYSLDDLKGQEGMGEEAIELISSMIDQDPKKRPDCDTVGKHPFFWSPVKRLDFLCLVSDRLEMIKLELKSLDKKATDFTIPDLEANRQEVIGSDWTKALCKAMNSELFAVKRRGYSGSNICDLLRAIRNKRHHWGDMQEDAKRATGELPADYVNYWQKRLPKMLMHVYRFVKKRREATFEERNNGGAVVMLGGTSTAFDDYFRGF